MDAIYFYGRLFYIGKSLVRLFTETNTPDEDRREVLNEFMTGLRTKDMVAAQVEGYALLDKVAARRGLSVSVPELEGCITMEQMERAARKREEMGMH